MTDIAPLAAWARARFGRNGVHARVRSGRTVHAVIMVRWVGDELVPELLCHTAVGGWSPAALEPTTAAVNCASCLRRITAGDRDGAAAAGIQLLLFDPAPGVTSPDGDAAVAARAGVCASQHVRNAQLDV